MRRRKFLKDSLFATGAAFARQSIYRASTDLPQGKNTPGEREYLHSPHLGLAYDVSRGQASLYLAQTNPLLLNATAAAVFPRGMALASDGNYSRRTRTTTCRDAGIEGEQLVVTCTDLTKNLDLQISIILLRDQPGAIFELVLTNVSPKEVLIRNAEPLRALLDENAGCLFSARNVLTNGYMHNFPGELLDLNGPDLEFVSFWNVAFYASHPQGALVVGFVENRQGEGQVAAGWEMTQTPLGGHKTFSLTGRSRFSRYFTLRPGASVSSGRLLLLRADDPFSGLEYYAETYGRMSKVKLNPIINGWCSWFYTSSKATEEEQLKNAEFIARFLKPYGMQWVQIDYGYQRAFGDWEANQLYPHGMKWLASKIRELGLEPGIWIAPYAIAEDSEIAVNHREWLIHDAAGNLQTAGDNYALDITHPDARKWMYALFEKIRHEWGYSFIKTDFAGWTILAAERYYDPTVSKAQAYRLGVETMRAAVGPDCHLLDCGPSPDVVGLVDSMRIDQDIGSLSWEQYSKNANCIAMAVAKRYYFHQRTWINDPDHLGLALLTISQAQAAASIIALSGGTVISGDRLYDLDPARIEILTKVLPAYGKAARPLDLFEKRLPETFALPIHRDFGEWWLVGCFNWDEDANVIRDFPLSRLRLDPGKSYLIYEFWSQRLLAAANQTVRLMLAPSSVSLLAIHEKRGVPQVLSTDRHYTQGALELEERALGRGDPHAFGSGSWRARYHLEVGNLRARRIWLEQQGRQPFPQ